MNKVIRLGMLFNEGDVPDFGSIVEDIHQRGLYYLLAKDIPKLNTMVTRAAAENYLIGNETFDFFSGYMAYVIDHKEAGTGEIYAYHRGKDRWYEFNIRIDKSFNEIMWERHKKILRETKTISGTAPLTFKSNGRPLKNHRIYGNTETKTRSYSGSAPLSFPIEDGSVSNYRIYGNTVNGESVGDLVTDSQSEHYGNYAIPITNNSETANIYLDEPLRKVGDEADYVDYATQKQHRVRKNLWSGVVEQGGVSNVGAYSQDAKRIRSRNVPLEPGTYTISTNLLLRVIYAYNEDNRISLCLDAPMGTYSPSFTVPAGANNITISMMKIVNNVQVDITPSDFIWGQIEKGLEATTYEPYIENTDLDVILPALPTLPGTNTLTVGTEVQPSSVAVEVNEILSCGDKITDNQSVNYGKYKIPLTLTADSAETTDIYLDEPLAKSGNNADYIDYATQKRHNSDGTESSVTLPEISTLAGTNTLTVGTEVQPSSVEIKGRIKAAGGD